MLAETLTQLRVGNQKFLIDFYQSRRLVFARWAQRQHALPAPAAHALLQATLVEFYDQVADGRLTLLPTDLRAHIHGMAQQHLRAQATDAAATQQALPAATRRRQRLLGYFEQLGPDCQRVLGYFYFRHQNLERLAGKLGSANALVAGKQKTACMRKLLELLEPGGPTLNLRPYLDELEQFADEQLPGSSQEAFELRLEHDDALAAAYEAYEQLTADLRWAAGHQSLQERLLTLDKRLDQRQTALDQAQRLIGQRRRRWLVRLGALLVAVLAGAWWQLHRPTAAGAPRSWQAYYQPDPGPAPTPALAQQRPLLYQALVQYRAGHYPAAQHTLSRISPVNMDPDSLSYLHGVFLLRQQQGLAAQPYLRRVSEQGNDALARRARYHLGMAYWQAGQLPQARALLQSVAADSLNDYRGAARRAAAEAVQ
ncbi:hypothetical protein [uncultured Hymenobacter sp.]|uniref:hypothetical protein n=1 Tax=uncultured Hymenobacter sp. TaxID=170016 RepID=UPI0035CA8FDD